MFPVGVVIFLKIFVGLMSVPEAYEKIRFAWIADRSVRLNISESVLTFST